MLVQLLKVDYDGTYNYGVFECEVQLTQEYICNIVRNHLKENIPEFSIVIDTLPDRLMKDSYSFKKTLFEAISNRTNDGDDDSFYDAYDSFWDAYKHVNLKFSDILIEKNIITPVNVPEVLVYMFE